MAMETKEPLNQFQEGHKKVQKRAERAREVNEKDSALQQKKARDEAIREGFDRGEATN
jgi:hypothetical protein